MRFFRSLPAALLIAALLPFHAVAGTTGGIVGRVVDSATQAPVAGVTVTANAPTQTATSVTDAGGSYRFLSLEPDTYTLSFTKDGYEPQSIPGESVYSDVTLTVNAQIVKALKTIAHVTSQAANNLVKSGQTSDLYSVNAAGQAAAQGLVGPGTLNNAYGAIASVPGVNLSQGESGWWQELHIRGGDIDQVGFELDGIPVNRVYDNAPETMLSSLGSQEVQVYTGGVPAGSDAQGISGYVNQVIKTGTYPGYATGSLAAGYPAFYHQASVEVGGSTPDRLFSYYAGFGGSNQDFRYIDNNNGASIPNTFFYPVSAAPGYTCGLTSCTPEPYSNGVVYTGAPSPVLFTSGLAFGLIHQSLRDSIINLHFGVPHKHSALRDDAQLFWMTSENFNDYFSSQNDFGHNVIDALFGPLVWDDTYGYRGAPMKPFDPTAEYKYFFPQSQPHQWQGALPLSIRDPNENGVSVSKAQYQHVFSPSEYLRVYGYALYSTWFINGYNSTAQPYYGWELPYFLPDHVYGFNASYENQLSSQHLFTATAAYTHSKMERLDISFFPTAWNMTSFVGKNLECYDPTTGDREGCYSQTQGTTSYDSSGNPLATPPTGYKCTGPTPPPACAENAQWLVTNTSFPKNALNRMQTGFYGYSIGDQWRPDDKLNVNLGMRLEDFQFIFADTSPYDPARQFWFSQYNQEYCFGIGLNSNKPVIRTNGGLGTCPTGTNPLAIQPQDPTGTKASVYGPLVNESGGGYTVARFEPRLGVTYTIDPTSVVRASFGIYARPP
ncbi:MAG: carboxypeptidase regulatory-like domain-containing protein, partial [Candidatus Eremiobacteraeota bacterium]|nr:carboxypeptidase regulatory-like domain-containing protein [Candidatus Eremiobacteraeota bacterium]